MIFVTGGTGLVGARLIFDLVKNGKQVTALIRENTPLNKVKALMRYYTENVDEIIDAIQWVRGDITDKELLFNVIKEGMEVYHCAGFVSFLSKDKDKIEEINVEGTANIVDSCLFNNAKKLCHVSSIGAIGGGLNGEPATENSPWSAGKKSAYSLSKYTSEMEVWRGIAEGLDAVIVNPAVILGPGNWTTGSPQIFNRVAKGMAFYTLGSTSYVDVRDVSEAMIQLMGSNISEERFILAAKTLTHKELFTKIALALGKKSPSKYAPPAITKTAWLLSIPASVFTRRPPAINRQTHQLAHQKSAHNGEKITRHVDFNYRSIDDTISFTAKCFKQ